MPPDSTLPTILHFYSLFFRHLNFPRWEASKGSPGNWQGRLSSSNSGQSCDPSEHRLRLAQYRWGSQPSFVWNIIDSLGYQLHTRHWLHSYLVTSPFYHTPLHPPDNRTPLMSCSHLWGWSPTQISSTWPTQTDPSVDPSDCLPGDASREPCSPPAGDLWSRLHCGTVNNLHSATPVLVTEHCFVAWISPPLLREKRKTKERIDTNT